MDVTDVCDECSCSCSCVLVLVLVLVLGSSQLPFAGASPPLARTNLGPLLSSSSSSIIIIVASHRLGIILSHRSFPPVIRSVRQASTIEVVCLTTCTQLIDRPLAAACLTLSAQLSFTYGTYLTRYMYLTLGTLLLLVCCSLSLSF